MLKIDKLKKQYKNFTLNCSMEVKEGMITGFVGPNGSGKSTTLKAVLGLIYIDGGDIQIFGKNVKDIKPEDKEQIGVEDGLLEGDTVIVTGNLNLAHETEVTISGE